MIFLYPLFEFIGFILAIGLIIHPIRLLRKASAAIQSFFDMWSDE